MTFDRLVERREWIELNATIGVRRDYAVLAIRINAIGLGSGLIIAKRNRGSTTDRAGRTVASESELGILGAHG